MERRLALHAAAAVLIYGLIRTLVARAMPATDGSRSFPALDGLSGLATTILAVYPLRVEVVAWPSCQPYLPCAGFALLSVLAQGPGRPCRLRDKSRREHRVTNSRPVAGAPGGRGSESRVRPRYRLTKATKCGGMGGWESERRIVPSKRGTASRDPVEGRRRRVMRPPEG